MMGEYGSMLEEWIVKIIKHAGIRSGSDSTVDARSETREIDHDSYWVCNA